MKYFNVKKRRAKEKNLLLSHIYTFRIFQKKKKKKERLIANEIEELSEYTRGDLVVGEKKKNKRKNKRSKETVK